MASQHQLFVIDLVDLLARCQARPYRAGALSAEPGDGHASGAVRRRS